MKGIRILIVSRRSRFREWLRLLLEAKRGLEMVIEASSDSEAWALAEVYTPDVVLMHSALPGLNRAAAAGILRRCPGCRVLMLTVGRGEQIVLEALAHGTKSYVVKTANAEELVDAIRAVHRGEMFLSATAVQA